MKKYYLFTPGPTPIPEEIRTLASRPIIHHRTDDFIRIYKECSRDLKYVFQTRNPVYILLASGTGAMETALINFLSPGDKIITINAGKFGERWSCLARAFQVRVIELTYAWGKTYRLEDIKKVLKEHPDVKAVYTQLCETSTGVKMDIKKLGLFLKDKPQILVVDAISGLGAVDFSMDRCHVDVCITASQKALMLPPGLGFISISPKAEKLMARSSLPKFYFDLKKYIKHLLDYNSPFTPNIMAIIQLNRSLKMIREEGLSRVFARHGLYARSVREAVKALGLKLLDRKNVSPVCTAVLMPAGYDAKEFLDLVKKKYNVVFAPGQGEYNHTMFRIGHVGHVSRFDIIMAVTALEMGLKEMGYSFPLGRGIAATEKILSKED